MTDFVDIRPEHLRIVQDVLRDHLPAGVEVRVFGSRAQWSARDASDLDLVPEGETEIDRKVIEALADALREFGVALCSGRRGHKSGQREI